VLQSEASEGIEEPGEIAGGGSEGVDGVQGGEEVFVEVAGVAGEVAFEEDGKALRVRIGAETVAQAAAGAGEDGGGELCGFSSREDGGGEASEGEALAFPEDGPAALRMRLQMPGTGEVGFRRRVRRSR